MDEDFGVSAMLDEEMSQKDKKRKGKGNEVSHLLGHSHDIKFAEAQVVHNVLHDLAQLLNFASRYCITVLSSASRRILPSFHRCTAYLWLFTAWVPNFARSTRDFCSCNPD